MNQAIIGLKRLDLGGMKINHFISVSFSLVLSRVVNKATGHKAKAKAKAWTPKAKAKARTCKAKAKAKDWTPKAKAKAKAAFNGP